MDVQTQLLAEQIAGAAHLDTDAATFLAEYALAGSYTGGTLHVGVGELGYETWLYAVVYPVNGRWYIAAGYRLADGRFRLHLAANGQDAKSLTWNFSFAHRCDYFTEVHPCVPVPPAGGAALLVPEAAPADSEPGHIYILKFDRPLGTAKHKAEFYGGWSRDIAARLECHAKGRGAKITRYAVLHGIGWQVVYRAPGTPADEQAMKARKDYRAFLASQGVSA